MSIVYFISIQVYGLAIYLASLLGNVKAKQFVSGRHNLLERLQEASLHYNTKRIWFHCASLGEFEQARPIIEHIHKKYKEYAIIVTFFSPSGYEIRKDYPLAAGVFYLPLDSPTNASRFISILKPSMVFFVKYEIWYFYLKALSKLHIPTFLLSANFRADHIYFKWYGLFFRKMLFQFNHVFTQNEASAELLKAHNINGVTVTNDTRFDRVFQHKQNVLSLPIIDTFKQNKKLLIAGSSYGEEEKIIESTLNKLPDWKVIIAPHHIQQTRIDEITKTFSNFSVKRYSEASIDSADFKDAQVLIIDNIGLLSSIYQYGDVAFVGGGYGKSGLHNMLEPAAFGLPILIGPKNHAKFPEAMQMKELGICFTVTNSADSLTLLQQWNANPEQYKSLKLKTAKFIESNGGAMDKVMEYLMRVKLIS